MCGGTTRLPGEVRGRGRRRGRGRSRAQSFRGTGPGHAGHPVGWPGSRRLTPTGGMARTTSRARRWRGADASHRAPARRTPRRVHGARRLLDGRCDTRPTADVATTDASCPTTAAQRLGWGAPTRSSDFADGLPPDWHPYGPEVGDDKKGVRTPEAITVRDGVATITATADGTTGAMS